MAQTDAKRTQKSTDQSPSQAAARADFLPTVRELAQAYQAFNAYADRHIRDTGLTPAQFDVIATLGNTNGMTMGEVAERTLVTKGTLTGIIDRLEQKNLVRREVPPDNRRCFTLVLTPEGEEMFEQVFPSQIAYLQERFDKLDKAELEQLRLLLKKVRELFPKVFDRDC